MRAIGQLPDETTAQALNDYLLVQGIPNQVEHEEDGPWTLWIHEDDHLARAQEILKEFLQNPKAAKFRRAVPRARDLRQQEAAGEKAWRKRFFERHTLWAGGGASTPMGWLTTALVGACLLVAVVTFVHGPNNPLVRALRMTDYSIFQTGLPEIRSGQVWRLVTPIFIHFGLLHLLFNMLWLLDLGNLIEARSGPRKLAAMVLVFAVLSNLGQYSYAGPRFGGMSGVVYGLFGYVWLRGKLDPRSGLSMDPTTALLMLAWFFLGLTNWVAPLANVAHATGLGLGLLLGYLAAKLNPGG
jgi:GlpG protein